MLRIQDEISITNEGLKIYISETEKRLNVLSSYVSEFNKLTRRLKLAKDKYKKIS